MTATIGATQRSGSRAIRCSASRQCLSFSRSIAAMPNKRRDSKESFASSTAASWSKSSSAWLSMSAWINAPMRLSRSNNSTARSAGLDATWAYSTTLRPSRCFRRNDLLYAFVRNYLPRHVVEERARKIPEYRLWAESGALVLTEGDMIDHDVIEADIRQACKQFDVRNIVFDTFSSTQMAIRLQTDGLPAIVEGKNAKNFTPPSIELEIRVNRKRFDTTAIPVSSGRHRMPWSLAASMAVSCPKKRRRTPRTRSMALTRALAGDRGHAATTRGAGRGRGAGSSFSSGAADDARARWLSGDSYRTDRGARSPRVSTGAA